MTTLRKMNKGIMKKIQNGYAVYKKNLFLGSVNLTVAVESHNVN